MSTQIQPTPIVTGEKAKEIEELLKIKSSEETEKGKQILEEMFKDKEKQDVITEYNWCYFTTGTKQKITNWFKVDKDILFVMDDKLYLFKENGFEDEELEKLFITNRQNIIRPILRKSRFYKHISPNIFHLPPNFDITNPDEWILVNIEKIELRSNNI